MIHLAGYAMVSVAVTVAVITVRLMADGKNGITEAAFAMETGNRALAAANLEDAAKAYIPGSPYPRQALRELVILARAAEIRGELDTAIAHWERIRRSIIATRHLYQPNRDLLTEAEENLVRIRSDAGPLDLSVDLTYRQRDPSAFLSMLIFAGLVMWIIGAVLIALAPKDRAGAPMVRPAYTWLLTLVGLATWIIAAALV